MVKLIFYVPVSHIDSVKSAVFATGAGNIGDYEQCCWQVLGEGQFKPLKGSQPYLGEQGKLEKVAEYRVEMVCDDQYVVLAVTALKAAHPYEEPAFDIIPLVDAQSFRKED
ncbi:NGG1p interacting factor NIF3 [Candidatus Endobugula sertula]|uniref:NGG1p interacting factor NIF3 n=1 Tax=Candidatus Endobugula sertula TaxID=62101 RepID=A0A1D2QMJ4_9GAMM|nr:NGG1p interacting factor NIF3 [Candidatus Endobugula sertula]